MMKHAFFKGAINHIDTAHTFRKHKSERTIGALLRTLTQKYKVDRNELFINTKIGVLTLDEYEEATPQL